MRQRWLLITILLPILLCYSCITYPVQGTVTGKQDILAHTIPVMVGKVMTEEYVPESWGLAIHFISPQDNKPRDFIWNCGQTIYNQHNIGDLVPVNDSEFKSKGTEYILYGGIAALIIIIFYFAVFYTRRERIKDNTKDKPTDKVSESPKSFDTNQFNKRSN